MSARKKRHRQPGKYRTLVLNADGRPLATYPLSIVPAQEAVTSVWKDRVIVVDSWDAAFRSPSVTIAVPKVIMLREYAPIAASPKFCRRSVYLRDRYRCQYCGEQFDSRDLTLDHVVPKTKGGKTVWTNVLTACLKCNGAKGDKHANYSGRKGTVARPFKIPRQPTTSELLRNGLELLPNDTKEDFGSFLYWNVELEP